jgi:predicted metal-dependent hydrolase
VIGYRIRVSSRAKRVRLVMTLDGLEVVIPPGFDQHRIPEVVDDKRAWIERAAAKLGSRRKRQELDARSLPEIVVLPAVSERWLVEYRPTKAAGRSRAAVRERPGWRLLVAGDPTDPEAYRQALCRWLRRRAKRELPLRLARLARSSGLGYEGVSIRQQRTRWGSCSRQGSISLNAKLLLLPASAVDYVLLHELCHTVEMNHSERFWMLVEEHDPDYREHRRLMKTAAKGLPGWMDHQLEGSLA